MVSSMKQKTRNSSSLYKTRLNISIRDALRSESPLCLVRLKL